MKNLISIIVVSFLLCGFAIAQTYGHQAAPTDRKAPPSTMSEPTRGDTMRITHGPVVEATGTNWATVAWSTDAGGSSIVRYGIDKDRLTDTAEAPYASGTTKAGETHRVKIEHLRPGTTYFFTVSSAQGEGTGTEAMSSVAQFTTKR